MYNVRDMYIYLWIREGCCIGHWIVVVKGIIDIKDKGVYAAALINKWCYWTKVVPHNPITNNFKDK